MKKSFWAALTLATVFVATVQPATAQSDPLEPVSVPIAFDIQNVNGSQVSCDADGQPYRLYADLVGPRAVLEGSAPAAATLYLHEYSYDDFWHFRAAPGVDFATELARLGHVTVALDRLGYDDSPHPDGSATCIGAHADMAHQIVTMLRAGKYVSAQVPPRGFQKVVLAGHSVGGVIAEVAAYSFKEIDALVLFAGYHTSFTPRALGDGVMQGQTCATSPQESGGSPNYAPYNPNDADFQYYGFADADPAVVTAATQARHLDPCGDVRSLIPASVSAAQHVDEVEVPVLLLWGRNDPVYMSDAGESQAADFSGSKDVTTVYFEKTAHALTLNRSAPQVQSAVSSWLTDRAFTSERPPQPPAPAPILRGCSVKGKVIAGTVDRDVLVGTAPGESLFGLDGNDSLAGKRGRDCLSGGRGNDRLDGGPGRDKLVGGAGADTLLARDGERDMVNCGAGRDRAKVDKRDRVRGCEKVWRR